MRTWWLQPHRDMIHEQVWARWPLQATGPSHGAGCQPGPTKEGEDRDPSCSTDGAPKPSHQGKAHPKEHLSSKRSQTFGPPQRVLDPLPTPAHRRWRDGENAQQRLNSLSTLPAATGSKLCRREKPHLHRFLAGVLWGFLQASQCVQGWIPLLWESASWLQPEQNTDFHSTI